MANNTAASTGTFPRVRGYLNPGTCRYCGHGAIRVEERLEALPEGAYSLAGEQDKVAARTWPYAVCEGCGHTSRGQSATEPATPGAGLRETP